MEVGDWIRALHEQGGRMADAAGMVSPDDAVPSCPGWAVRDLVHHTGRIHRWAGLMISEGRTVPPSDDEQVIPDGWPSDDDLVDWFREGYERLVTVLEDAPPDLDCWTFTKGTAPRAFWARRQAHETSIHRVDTELVAGDPSGFDPVYAADGIDELLAFFITRPGRSPSAPQEMSLGVVAADVGQEWMVTFGPDAAWGRRGAARADCTVSGPASDLFMLLWNRIPLGNLAAKGDMGVLEQWRESASF